MLIIIFFIGNNYEEIVSIVKTDKKDSITLFNVLKAEIIKYKLIKNIDCISTDNENTNSGQYNGIVKN